MLTASIPRSARALALLLLSAACGSPAGESEGSGSDTDAGTGAATDAPTTGSDSAPAGDCGNDIREEGEACDGADLGGQQCADVNPAYTGGTLACGASCTLDAAGCVLAPDSALVTLNELTSEAVLAGSFAGKGDAIELYNGGKQAADLSGWKLSDDPTFPDLKTYVFPPGSALGPGEFTVLIAMDTMAMTGDLPFGLNAKATETVTLADGGGETVDSVTVDGYKAVVSYCRLPDAIGAWEQCEQTFGAANQLAATACGNDEREDAEACDGSDLAGQTCAGLKLGYSGGSLGCTLRCRFDAKQCTTDSTLVINELESTADDIEIYNGGAAAVDMSGWILTDDRVDELYDPKGDTAELVFPPGTKLAAQQYLVVQIGTGPGQHPFGLGAMGDTVTLLRPGPIVIDQVSYGPDEAAVSYCRKPSGPGGTWKADCVPTLGGPN
jgi:hypothetical protein